MVEHRASSAAGWNCSGLGCVCRLRNTATHEISSSLRVHSRLLPACWESMSCEVHVLDEHSIGSMFGSMGCRVHAATHGRARSQLRS
jgi:hypothetical protein